MNLGQRIKEKRTEAGLTQEQVADYFGIKSPSVAGWEVGSSRPDIDKLVKLARLLKTSVDYLLTGKTEYRVEEPRSQYNVVSINTAGKLPVISEVQAGNWSEIIDNFQPGDADEWIACPFNHSKSAFILKVVGFSMYNPGGDKSYAPGEYIAVDPEKEALNRSMVVARIDHEERATFKQLLIDSEGNTMLNALNPSHVPKLMSMPEGSRIVGVVLGKWVPE